MKTIWLIICVVGFSFRASAQQHEIEQLLLNVEKLAQFKEILQQMKDGYEILVKGYNTIKDLSEGNFNLHQVFLNGLLEVSPTVKKYKRIAEIIEMQVELTKQCRGALKQFKASMLFGEGELDYLEGVYQRLFNGSLRNLEDLTTVITAGQVRMSDDERLQMIDKIYEDMSDRLVFLRSFNEDNKILLLLKAKERRDAGVLHDLFGVQD